MSRVLDLSSQPQAFDGIPAALDALQQGYLVLGAQWRVLYANPAAGRIWGFDAESAVGRDLRAVCPGFVESNGHACCTGVLASGRPARFDLHVFGTLADGAAYEIHVDPVPSGLSLLAVDVTQRRRAESSVRELNAELSATMQAIPDLLFEVDAHGVYLNVWARNPALLAREREALIGQRAVDVLPAEAAEVAMAALHEATEQGTSFGKVMRLDVAGGTRWFEMSVARKAGLPGSPPRFMVLSRDITEREQGVDAFRRKEAELLRSREQLRSLAAHQEHLIDEERKHIAGEIHDHLGQQLTALRLEVGLLRMQHTEHAEVMNFCKRMSAQIDETIAIVRSVATTLHPIEIDLGLRHAVLSLADTFEKRYGIQCEVRCPEPEFSPPRTLAAMIYRVIQESLTNVARHADADHVELVGTVGNGWVEITIADNGIGFDLKSALEGGTYGLFGMQERVNAIGGELLIDSCMDQGTSITIRLPWEGQ